MKKTELLKKLSEQAGVSQKDVSSVLDALSASISETLGSGEKLAVSGLGTFDLRHNSARTGRNPQTGETIQIAASKSVKFKPAKQLKDAVK